MMGGVVGGITGWRSEGKRRGLWGGWKVGAGGCWNFARRDAKIVQINMQQWAWISALLIFPLGQSHKRDLSLLQSIGYHCWGCDRGSPSREFKGQSVTFWYFTSKWATNSWGTQCIGSNRWLVLSAIGFRGWEMWEYMVLEFPPYCNTILKGDNNWLMVERFVDDGWWQVVYWYFIPDESRWFIHTIFTNAVNVFLRSTKSIWTSIIDFNISSYCFVLFLQ